MSITKPRTGIALLCIFLGACNQSEPQQQPPAAAAPKTEAAAPAVDESIKRLAGEIYVFAYPLVLMDATRQSDTVKAPINTFQHDRAKPSVTAKDAFLVNTDVLFSRAWLDLSKGPVVLSFPDTHGRYYVMPMLDAWTNVFSSPGKRESGTEKREFVVVGPSYKKQLPPHLSPINAPTDMVWVVGRIDPGGPGGFAAVAKLQEQFKAVPLAQWSGHSNRQLNPTSHSVHFDSTTSPLERVAKMDAGTYLARFAELLAGNPPAKDDAPMIPKMAKLGIVAGQPFNLATMDSATSKAVEAGVNAAREALAVSARSHIGDLTNGWSIDWNTGRYGTYYGLRAVMAALFLGANAPEDAVFAQTRVDSDGKRLSGANNYVLHFDKGRGPPTNAFWALSMYGDDKRLVPNPLGRFAIGDNDPLQYNDDGSLDVFVQPDMPGADRASTGPRSSNWLPSPKGDFILMLRIYWPAQELLDRKWAPPPVRIAR